MALSSGRLGAVPRLLLVSLLFLGLTGCNRALRDALARAEAAHGRGDHFGEAMALRDACRAAPDEPEICRAAREAADEVIAKQLQTAQGPCSTEPTACLAALEVLAPFAGATDPRLQPYFDRAGDMLTERCEGAALESVEDAVFHVRCAEAYGQRIATPTYAAHVAAARRRAGAWVEQAAAAYAAQPGVAWLHEALAACLGGSSSSVTNAQAYRASFDASHALALQVTGRSPYAGGQLCAELQSGAGSLLRCDGVGRAFPIAVDAWVDPMTDAPIHELRTVEVLDHTERWENPNYRNAQAEARHAFARHEDAVSRLRLATADCESASSALSRAKYCYNCAERTNEETACKRKSAAEDIERRSRRTMGDAESTLSSTPAYLSRNIYRNVSYRNVEHHFRIAWHVRVTVGSRPYEQAGAMAFDSSEREGVPAANIGYLPYSEPSAAQVQGQLAAATVDQARAALAAELDRQAQALIASCPAPDTWSDCQIEAALLRRSDPVQQFVTDVGEKLDARSGQAWPKAACIR